MISRKVLSSSFDFTPFLNHQQQQQRDKKRRRSSPNKPEQSNEAEDDKGSEIDPRYGVEKRRVPTGPNPLHH